MKKTFLIAGITIALLFSSCASIVSGSKQNINFNSTPSGATVWVDDVNLGVTPVIASIGTNQEKSKSKNRITRV